MQQPQFQPHHQQFGQQQPNPFDLLAASDDNHNAAALNRNSSVSSRSNNYAPAPPAQYNNNHNPFQQQNQQAASVPVPVTYDDMSYASMPVQMQSQRSNSISGNNTIQMSSNHSVVSYQGAASVQTAPANNNHNNTTMRMRSTATATSRSSELEYAYANPNSPLPIATKVVASGFILARISFRTILFKKWKQAYWVQYGPNTIYIFRSVADYEDWLRNPYHDQKQRDYLVKLKIDFIADLLQPDVTEYKMTHVSRKNYSKHKPLYHQFKLERWMDFGPTIVAAFASQDPKEVDALRTVISQCKRNASNAGEWSQQPAVAYNNGSVASSPPAPIPNAALVVAHHHQQNTGYQNYQY